MFAIPNVQVDTGTPLVQIEAVTGEDFAITTERLVLGATFTSEEIGEDGHSRSRQHPEELRQLILGFDVDPSQTARLLSEWDRYCAELADGAEARKCEDEILQIFVDICFLFHREAELDDPTVGEAPSPEAYLFSYLRMLETRGDGLPPAFVDALRQALAHYEVRTLDRLPELEESLVWIYKSHQRVEQQVALILGLLERRLAYLENLPAQAGESFRRLLDRMISMSRGQFPAISDLARELRYRCFEQPLFEQARKKVYANAEEHLAHLAANSESNDRLERMQALVECPQPLVSLFAAGSLPRT